MPLLLQSPPMFLTVAPSPKNSKVVSRLSSTQAGYPSQSSVYSVVMALSFSCENLRNHLELSPTPTPLLDQGSSRILILDCRTFLAHSDRHIIGAVNVHCPAILRRRHGNKLPLRTVIGDREVRERLLKGLCSPVVLYEETSANNLNQHDSMAAFVARCLQNEAAINNVYILEGGFQQFRHQYPHLCASGGLVTSSPWGLSAPPPSSGPRSPSYWPGVQSHHSTLSSLSRSSSSPALATSSVPWYQHDQQEPVEILTYLYLGSEYHASSKAALQRLKITALLNVSHNCPNHFEDAFKYMSIPIEDSTNEDIGVWFRKAIDYINDVKSSGGKVLVHCHAGISRSATICMAYLMATLRLRMEDAYEYVKCRRKIISPNFAFMGQLLSFESQVFSPRPQRSPRSPLSSLQPCNNNNSAGATPSPRGADSPKTPSSSNTPTAFDFSISPSTLASLVNSSTGAGSQSASPSPSPTTPRSHALCPSSPYSP